MPIEFIIDKGTNTALITAEGELTLKQCLEAVPKLKRKKDFTSDMKILADLRQIELVLKNPDVQSIADKMKDLRNDYRDIALYVHPKHSFQIKMFTVFTDLSTLNIKVCETEDEIKTWSEQPVPALPEEDADGGDDEDEQTNES